MLSYLGRCYRAGGHFEWSEAEHRNGLAVTQQLDQSRLVKRVRGAHHTELADVLTAQGKFAEARQQYQEGLKIAREITDLRNEGVSLGQLGVLDMEEGKLADAASHAYKALELFRRLNEPSSVATILHQLGRVFQKARQLEQAEQHYRESASLSAKLGNLAVTAMTWNQLAMLSEDAGKLKAAEMWYRRAIDGGRQSQDISGLVKRLRNLAHLLQGQPGRLAEACQLAEEALTLAKTLDPSATEIWNHYRLLADIADKESAPDKAADYRRLAREAKRNFAGTAHEMRRFAAEIAAVVDAIAGIEDAKSRVNQFVTQCERRGGEDAEFAKSIEQMLAGERDVEILCSGLGPNTAMIIETIFQALEDSSILQDLMPEDDTPQ